MKTIHISTHPYFNRLILLLTLFKQVLRVNANMANSLSLLAKFLMRDLSCLSHVNQNDLVRIMSNGMTFYYISKQQQLFGDLQIISSNDLRRNLTITSQTKKSVLINKI